jgi:ArsR family metal-binding transcriptional regulator
MDETNRPAPCADDDHDWVLSHSVVEAFGEVVRDLPTAKCARCGEVGTVTYERES